LRLAGYPSRLERLLRRFARWQQSGVPVAVPLVLDGDAVDRPLPDLSAADGDGAVDASDPFAPLVDDVVVLGVDRVLTVNPDDAA
jgi:hypothetical protein